jgi:hypothetical protein
MVAHLKLLIAKMKRDRFGQSSERGQHLLDQMELQLASAAEASVALSDTTSVVSFARRKPVRAPMPAHLSREPVEMKVVPPFVSIGSRGWCVSTKGGA